MISIRQLSLQYGTKCLYNDISLQISAQDRIALVGRNGCGKSTLLKILCGLESADIFDAEMAKTAKVAYLPQDGIELNDNSLWEEMMNSVPAITELENQLHAAQEEMHAADVESDEYRELLEKIASLEETLHLEGAHQLAARIERVLKGLGFKADTFQQNCLAFSGGWRMRIGLAKLLLQEPDLLLLDEPTNHLDLPSLQWLESYMKKFTGSFILVSHDQAFMDAVCKRVILIENGKMLSVKGNYSHFVEVEKHRRETLIKQAAQQEKAIAKTEAFIDRFRAKATKAAQVQGRIKALDKVERIVIEEEHSNINLRFPAAPRGGQVLLKAEGICQNYDDKIIFKDLALAIERGERIALVGINGAGKSTLARILSNTEAPKQGTCQLGHDAILSYFAQNQSEALDGEATILECLENVAPREMMNQLRTLLGTFLFHGDDVYKKTKVLSGGERCRVALAQMLVRPANILVMDEPTNHLDIPTKKILQEALQQFPGAMILISHDRTFLDPIVDRVWELHNGTIKEYMGTVTEYLDNTEFENQENETSKVTKNQESPKERRKRLAALREQLSPLKKEISKQETKIEALEEEKSTLESSLANPDVFKSGEAPPLVKQLEKVETALSQTLEQWEKNSATLEQLEAEMLANS